MLSHTPHTWLCTPLMYARLSLAPPPPSPPAPSLTQVMDLFHSFDSDHSGEVDRDEFRRAIAALGYDVPRDALDAVFDSMDDDCSGTLSFKEIHKQLRIGAMTHIKSRKHKAGAAGAIAVRARNAHGLRGDFHQQYLQCVSEASACQPAPLITTRPLTSGAMARGGAGGTGGVAPGGAEHAAGRARGASQQQPLVPPLPPPRTAPQTVGDRSCGASALPTTPLLTQRSYTSSLGDATHPPRETPRGGGGTGRRSLRAEPRPVTAPLLGDATPAAGRQQPHPTAGTPNSVNTSSAGSASARVSTRRSQQLTPGGMHGDVLGGQDPPTAPPPLHLLRGVGAVGAGGAPGAMNGATTASAGADAGLMTRRCWDHATSSGQPQHHQQHDSWQSGGVLLAPAWGGHEGSSSCTRLAGGAMTGGASATPFAMHRAAQYPKHAQYALPGGGGAPPSHETMLRAAAADRGGMPLTSGRFLLSDSHRRRTRQKEKIAAVLDAPTCTADALAQYHKRTAAGALAAHRWHVPAAAVGGEGLALWEATAKASAPVKDPYRYSLRR